MGAEIKEKSVRGQSPWIVLIERSSENGRRIIETRSRSELDPSLNGFLRSEGRVLDAQVKELRKSIQQASERRSHGKLPSARQMREVRDSMNRDLAKKLEYKEILSGERREPIKIIIDSDGGASWSFPSGDDAIWTHFLRNERIDILNLPSQDRSLLYEAFLLRISVMQSGSGAVRDWHTFVREKIGERTDLDDYLAHLTRRFQKN